MKGLASFGELKPPVKAAVVVGSGGGLMAALYALFGSGSLPILAVGIALIVLLVVGYKQIIKLLDKRKAAPMERAVKSSAAATPTGITEPAKRARLDDLRKNFDTGIEKFRAAGKNLYSLPWYVLVGEPGSGKTEAIRRSNVGFPPGLQDQLQGAGGTVNMNWWFTNHAVIVDTAGRLMFEEIEPGSTSEWQEFLKLIKKIRPNCPLNGMLLVIPAESLIRDTADAIERKGGKIAQQLDQIQRTLGVRFPVFVVVTKCDLINGFREFFDEVTDPMLQHQMLGWSNPGSLDDTFNPELVDQHLKTVQERLLRRRLTLMQDPVNTENQSARRTDQVDALFAFPESLMKIAPRLRRYLEMIFVAGTWSAKPLFLRGIYFTSSMREGSALDADLAEALGMPVESLPEGKVWERERAFFLRDIFLSKVFRERGLVTRASNTSSHLKKRRAIVYGTAFVGAIVLLAFTIFAYYDLKHSIDGPATFWERVSTLYMTDADTSGTLGTIQNKTNFPNDPSETYFTPIIFADSHTGPPFLYWGGLDRAAAFKEIVPKTTNTRSSLFPSEIKQQAETPIPAPLVFSVWAMITGGGSLDVGKREFNQAAGVIVRESILRPVVEAARLQLKSALGVSGAGGAAWSPDATRSLVELLKLEVASVAGPDKAPPTTVISVGAIFPYLFATGDPSREKAVADAATDLDGVVAWTYAAGKGGQPWPPPALVRAGTAALVEEGVNKFVASQGSAGATPGLAEVLGLVTALDELESAERLLHRVVDQPPPAQTAWWNEKYAELLKKQGEVDELIHVVNARTLSKAYDDERKAFLVTVNKSYGELMTQLKIVLDDNDEPRKEIEKKPDLDRIAALQGMQKTLRTSLQNIQSEGTAVAEARTKCSRHDLLHFTIAPGAKAPHLVRREMYQVANAVFTKTEGEQAVKIGELTGRLQGIALAAKAADTDVTRLGGVLANPAGETPDAKNAKDFFEGSRKSSVLAVRLGRTQRSENVVGAWINQLAGAPGQIEAKTAELVGTNKWEVPRPVVPLTSVKEGDLVQAGFVPRAAAAVLQDCDALAKIVEGKNEGEKIEVSETLGASAKQLKEAAAAYGQRYLAYWKRLIGEDLAVHLSKWDDATKFLNEYKDMGSVNTPLNKLGTLAMEAFDKVNGLVAADADGKTPAQLSLDVKNSVSNLEELEFRAGIKALFNNWAKLSPTAARARSDVIAAYTKGELEPEYVYTVKESKKSGLVEKYWADFSLRLLTSLANEAGDVVTKAIADLGKLARFPIVPPKKNEPELSVAEVVAARGILKVAQAAAASGDPAVIAPAQRIRKLPDDVQKEINKLLGIGRVDEKGLLLIAQFQIALVALPEIEGKVIKCEKIEKSDPPGEAASTIGDTWTHMSVAVGGVGRPVERVRFVPTVKLADEIAYPDKNDLDIRFHKAENDPPDAGITIHAPGPWAPLHFLLDPLAAKVRGAGKEWFVQYKYKVGPEERTVWIKLTFDREMPNVPAWRGEKKP